MPVQPCAVGQWTGLKAATGCGVGHTGLWSCLTQQEQRTGGGQSPVTGPPGGEGGVPLLPPIQAFHLGERSHQGLLVTSLTPVSSQLDPKNDATSFTG